MTRSQSIGEPMGGRSKTKRGQIYFSDSIRGLPCCRCSILRPIIASTSSTNRSLPVSWPLCNAERITSHSPGGIAKRTNLVYRVARTFEVSPSPSKQGSVSNQANSSLWPTRCA